MFSLPDDIWSYITKYCTGTDCTKLRLTSKSAYKLTFLQYNGPVTDSQKWVLIIPPERYAYMRPWLPSTPNGYTYCMCSKPTKLELNSSLWLNNMACDTTVSASEFLCGYLALRDFVDPITISSIRDILDTLWSDTNTQQFLKVRLLLDIDSQRNEILDCVLRVMCMHSNIDMVRFILSNYTVTISAEMLMVALLATDETNKMAIVKLLLDRGAPISEFDFWPLKYTAHVDDWDKFRFLYYYYLNSHNLSRENAISIAHYVIDTLKFDHQQYASNQVNELITEFYR